MPTNSSTHATSYSSCRTGSRSRDVAPVVYYEGDFKHRWPVSATQRVWDFLRAHPLPPKG